MPQGRFQFFFFAVGVSQNSLVLFVCCVSSCNAGFATQGKLISRLVLPKLSCVPAKSFSQVSLNLAACGALGSPARFVCPHLLVSFPEAINCLNQAIDIYTDMVSSAPSGKSLRAESLLQPAYVLLTGSVHHCGQTSHHHRRDLRVGAGRY